MTQILRTPTGEPVGDAQVEAMIQRIAELEAALADTTRRIDAMTEFVTMIMPYMEKLTEEIVPVEVTLPLRLIRSKC